MLAELQYIACSLWGGNNETKMWSSPSEMCSHITSFYDIDTKYYRDSMKKATCNNRNELYQFHLNWAKENSVVGWKNKMKSVYIDLEHCQVILIVEYELYSNDDKFNKLTATYIDDMIIDPKSLKITRSFATLNGT